MPHRKLILVCMASPSMCLLMLMHRIKTTLRRLKVLFFCYYHYYYLQIYLFVNSTDRACSTRKAICATCDGQCVVCNDGGATFCDDSGCNNGLIKACTVGNDINFILWFFINN